MEEITAVLGAITTTVLLMWLTSNIIKTVNNKTAQAILIGMVTLTLITVYCATTVIVLEG